MSLSMFSRRLVAALAAISCFACLIIDTVSFRLGGGAGDERAVRILYPMNPATPKRPKNIMFRMLDIALSRHRAFLIIVELYRACRAVSDILIRLRDQCRRDVCSFDSGALVVSSNGRRCIS